MKAKGPDTFWSWWGLAKNSWKMLEGGGTMSVTGAGSNLGDFRTHFVSSNFCRKLLFILSVVLKSWPVCRQTAENVGETAVPGPMCTWRNFWPHFVFSYFLRKLLFLLSVVLKSWPVWLETAENVRETAVPAKPVKFSIRRSKRESSASKNSFSKYVPRNYLRLTQARQIVLWRFAYPPPLYTSNRPGMLGQLAL